jgi:predicted outer membrane protein
MQRFSSNFAFYDRLKKFSTSKNFFYLRYFIAFFRNITTHQEKLNEDVGSLKSAIEKTLDDSDKLRKKLVQNDQDRDLRLAKLGKNFNPCGLDDQLIGRINFQAF